MATSSASNSSSANTVKVPAFDQFLAASNLFDYQVPNRNPIAENSLVYFDFPKDNLALRLIVTITGTVTIAGTVTSGTWSSYPNEGPLSWIQRWQIANNNSVMLQNLSGPSLVTWLRYKQGVDINNTLSGFSQSSDVVAQLGYANPIVPGANIAAGSYSLNKVFAVPIAFNHAGSLGLINLQNNANQFSLMMQLGTIVSGIGATGGSTNLITSLVGTGLTATLTGFNIQVQIETYSIPTSVGATTSKFMFVQDATQTLVNGINQFNVPQTELVTMLIAKLANAGSYVPAANLQFLDFKYGGNRYRFHRTPQSCWGQNVADIEYNVLPQNGSWAIDMQHRKGNLIEQDIFDVFNDTQVTDLSLVATTTGLTLSGISQMTLITESLRSQS